MRAPSTRALGVLVAAAAIVAGSCSSHPSRAALPPPPQVVRVTISDSHFTYNPVIRAGRVVFDGRNVGRVAHTMLVFPVGNDYPPVDVQLHGKVRRPVQPFGGTRVKPGASNSFALDLVRGQRYYMVDFDLDPARVAYALKGLDSEFRAQ